MKFLAEILILLSVVCPRRHFDDTAKLKRPAMAPKLHDMWKNVSDDHPIVSEPEFSLIP